MHQIQKVFLKRLTTTNNQRYADLTRGYNFEDNVVFHLKKLVESGFVVKDNTYYSITAKGIKAIYEYDLSDLSSPGVKTFFCGFIVTDGLGNFLVKGHPSAKINFYNLPSGRPKFGQPMELELPRLFFENTGIMIDPSRFLFTTLHGKIVKTKDGEDLFDDGQAIYRIEISEVEKSRMKLLEGVEWISREQLILLRNCWPEIKMCLLDKIIKPYASYEISSNYIL
ncbi:MAG: hypothetical protein AUJ28_00235 [Parcubacteria group bacterium CG1_02_37_51]|nr:MAG: hypothetical protein AUJ28_00235 [Parcubacteria group bacterium CG1_02_37_51]